MYYLIKERLRECKREELMKDGSAFVAVLSGESWAREKEFFDMGIDMTQNLSDIVSTKAEINYDSITGTFSIPNHEDLSKEDLTFAFAADEKGIVFIDDGGNAESLLAAIKAGCQWKMPSLECFLYDFLAKTLETDSRLLEGYESCLEELEEEILSDKEGLTSPKVHRIRKDIRNLRDYYEQLIDFMEVLIENENGFFKEENLRYFSTLLRKAERLRDKSNSIREYTYQIRDIYKAHLDIRQNRIMTALTVVTTIFMPLTLLVGWYGMNFKYMPEIEWRFGYLLIILLSIGIILGEIYFFKKKKWL